ncbi:hypothetical protein [Thermovibrio sp.]
MVKLLSLFLLFLLLTSNSYASWYVLLPKKRVHGEVKKFPPIKFDRKKVKPKPYSVEVRKLLAPTYTIHTFDLKKITKEELLGKTVIFLFVDNLFSPETERLARTFKELSGKETVFVVVDLNDSDFALLKSFKEFLGLRRVIITADSYLFKQFRLNLKNLSTPSIVAVDKYGFIRYFSPKVEGKEVRVIKGEIEEIVKELSKV